MNTANSVKIGLDVASVLTALDINWLIGTPLPARGWRK
jgi:hypothetical protein